MRRDSGFTLIEVLVGVAITSILLTLGAFAARHYWWQQTIDGESRNVTVQLRRLQQKSVTESHPLVYGAWFKTGSNQWGSLKFDPLDLANSADDTCAQQGSTKTFGSGVTASAVSFATIAPQSTVCASAVPSGAKTVFFFARGTSNGGSLTLSSSKVTRTITVTVNAVTGRVETS